MRKTIIMLMIINIFIISLLPAAVGKEDKLMVSAVVPEDYGVEFPLNALHIDRMYFSLTDNEDSLIPSDQLSAGTMHIGMNEFRITLLYYGNQSEDYSFILETDAGDGWRDSYGNIIPISVCVVDNSEADDIKVTEMDMGSAEVTVPANGPRRGEAAADIVFEWSGEPDPEPGIYTVDVNLCMYAV